jgi:uncharacterized protein YdhG (YjbR/CyaY superfamily)
MIGPTPIAQGDRVAAPTSAESYLAALPVAARAALEGLRQAIRDAAPGATETISYQLPAFRDEEGRSLVAYGAFKHHYSLFPMSTKVLDDLGDEIRPFRSGKGTLRFEFGAPLPAPLVGKIVRARIAENAARTPR